MQITNAIDGGGTFWVCGGCPYLEEYEEEDVPVINCVMQDGECRFRRRVELGLRGIPKCPKGEQEYNADK